VADDVLRVCNTEELAMRDSGDKSARVESEKTWGAHSRATAQTAILINGGAATIVLASFSKDATALLTRTAAVALFVYALGVLVGGICMLFVTRGAAWLSSYWANYVDNPKSTELDSDNEQFEFEYWRAEVAFICSLSLFFIASTILAVAVVLR
jgi:hypothetical protein